MEVGQRTRCDFVIFTNKGINVERISYNDEYWKNTFRIVEHAVTIIHQLVYQHIYQHYI